MNKKQIALGVLLCDFLALTVYAVEQYGIVGLVEQATANVATITLLTDLTIALSMVMVWMWQDARQRGVSVLPYLLLTCTLGSVGPLLYLIRRFGRNAATAGTASLATHAHPARAGA